MENILGEMSDPDAKASSHFSNFALFPVLSVVPHSELNVFHDVEAVQA